MLTRRGRNRGFTLIEMSISTMILCVATLALGGLLVHGVRAWSSGTSQDNVTGEVSIAMERLSADIRDGVSASVLNGMLIVNFPTMITDSTTGESVYDFSSSNTTSRRYFIQNGNLVRMIGSNITVIGRGVTSATFWPTGGSVTVTLTATERVGSNSCKSKQVSSRVSLRNYRS